MGPMLGSSCLLGPPPVPAPRRGYCCATRVQRLRLALASDSSTSKPRTRAARITSLSL